MSQFLRPDGLVSAGSWTNNHTAIDESTASDADYAYSQNNPNGSSFEVSLSNPSLTPGAGTYTVRYRFARSDDDAGTIAPSSGGTSTTLTVSVMQGATVIATDSGQATASGSWTTRTWTPDLSAITDWTDVRLLFNATGGGGSTTNRRGVAVSWAEIEVPDGATSQSLTPGLLTSSSTIFSSTVTNPPENFVGIVNRVNTTVTHQGSGVYRIEKTGGTNAVYDADAISTTALTGDFVLSATFPSGGAMMIGVNSDPTTDSNWPNIDFAGYWNPGGTTIYIYESGVEATSFTTGVSPTFWIWRTGSTLYYGEGADFATASASPKRTVGSVSSTLYFDSSFNGSNSQADVSIQVPKTLSPSLLTNNQTFFGPTVTRGAVTLTAPLFTNNQTFHAATVAQVTNLTAGLLTNSQTFPAATVTRGAVTLTAGLLSNSQTFFGPTVSRGAVTLTPGLLTSNQSFFAATVTTSKTLTAGLLTNSSSFFAATVLGVYSLTAPLVTSSQSFFGPTISTSGEPQTLTVPLTTISSSFFGPTVTTTTALTSSLFSDSQTFYAATVSSDVDLTASLITNSQTFHSANVAIAGAPQTLTASLFSNSPTVYEPTLTTENDVTAPLLTNSDNVFSGTITTVNNVEVPALSSEATLFLPSIIAVADETLAAPLVDVRAEVFKPSLENNAFLSLRRGPSLGTAVNAYKATKVIRKGKVGYRS